MAAYPPLARALTVVWLALACAIPVPAAAVQPSERLADPALEARAREISRELRCVVCQNQSIDDSDAELAHDLRIVVRERLAAGDGDEEVIDYVVSRYGDFVLLRPPFKASTYALWLGPLVVLALGAIAVALSMRRQRMRPAPSPLPLSAAEEERLARVVEEHRG